MYIVLGKCSGVSLGTAVKGAGEYLLVFFVSCSGTGLGLGLLVPS